MCLYMASEGFSSPAVHECVLKLGRHVFSLGRRHLISVRGDERYQAVNLSSVASAWQFEMREHGPPLHSF